jgi:arsenite methyltransferase
MSSTPSPASDQGPHSWLWPLIGRDAAPSEGERWSVRGHDLVMHNGIARVAALHSAAQAQTGETFSFKWAKRDTFESPKALARMREWLVHRYGDMREAKWLDHSGGRRPVVLDAGCGAAMSALELFGPVWSRLRYLGSDISAAVDVARDRVAERGLSAMFLQADLSRLPLPPQSVDVIFSEGVLHHTDSTEGAFRALVPLLKPRGRFMFYVYRQKGPVREYTDDLIRARLRSMTPEEAWQAMLPLTNIGIALGALDAEIDIPEPIELLGIPAGRINVQRLFYWHVAKAFYRPDYTVEEMNHINFDWYAPTNAHRHTLEEVRAWVAAAGLEIERERSEEAGITIIAVRR